MNKNNKYTGIMNQLEYKTIGGVLLRLCGVVARLRYALGNLVLSMFFIVLVIPLYLAYILTGNDYALQYIKWADNVFERP